MLKSRLTDARFKLSVGVPLLLAGVVAWYASIFLLQTNASYMPTQPSSAAPTLPIATMTNMFSSLDSSMILSFLLVWVVGMVAMMFPAMIPVISLHSRYMQKEEHGSRLSLFTSNSLFLTGYLSLYALLGAILFIMVYSVFQLGFVLPWLSSFSLFAVAAVLALAGVWQLTSLKERCLSKCASPIGFFLTHAKSGPTAAIRMGAEHGFYCVGCCWLYMMVMLAVAALSIPSMILLSGLIIVEKAFVGRTAWFKWLSAGIFLVSALIVATFPSLLTSL